MTDGRGSEFVSLLRAAVEEFNAGGEGDKLAGRVTDLCDEYGGSWKLMQDEHTLLTGTEQEVRAMAQEQVTDAHQRYHHQREAELRAELYLERPDGKHLGQKYDEAGFVPGEPIEWVDVDW